MDEVDHHHVMCTEDPDHLHDIVEDVIPVIDLIHVQQDHLLHPQDHLPRMAVVVQEGNQPNRLHA